MLCIYININWSRFLEISQHAKSHIRSLVIVAINAFNMFNALKLNTINIFFYMSLAAVICPAISVNTEDNKATTTNQDNIKPLNIVVNTDQNNGSKKLFIQSSIKRQLAISDNKIANLAFDTEQKLLEKSLLSLKRESEENLCLLDSLKKAIIWWSHSNGTLRETNVHLLSNKQQLDLSYRSINDDESALKMVSKRFPNEENLAVAVFSLAYNNLTQVPFQTLEIMANSLKYLSLMGNPFMDIKITPNEENSPKCVINENDLKFIKNGDVTRLFLNKRKQLVWATFPKMASLIELDISNCDIEYISKNAFQNLTNLKNLYMSHNKILNIPADTFLHTPYLQVLDLSFSNVYHSLINRLIHSPNLESIIKLFYGVNIEQTFFNYLPNLVYLDLSHTKLRSSSALAFSHIGPALKYLSLCYTSFPVFDNEIFKNSSLIGLDLSGNTNAAFGLDEDVFENLSQSLNFLFFENANLRQLSWLKHLKNLRFLALAGNNINNLSAKDFMPLKRLQILDLSSNHINNWYFRVFQHNENLRILGLRDNNINFISSAMLNDLSMLIYLSLGSNNFICDCTLHDLVDVSSLNNQQAQCEGNFSQMIRDNIHINSTYLPEIIKNSKLFLNTSLSGLDISSLIVSQNLYKFQQAIKKISHSLNSKVHNPGMRFFLRTLRSYNNSIPCLHDNNSASAYFSRKINDSILKFQLLDYQEEQYWCYNQSRKESPRRLNCQRAYMIDNIEQELNALTTYILASVGGFILIALIGILAYYKRWHIYYYYSSLKTAALLSVASKDKHDSFKNLCDSNSNMIYDVFISYCQSDRDWILEELMPNIEEAGDISVCLHERDFQVGITILDNIISCMERSKAMMLIISSSFLLSHWCQFEMQLAHHHILDLSKDNLILVLLEDIPRSKRPKNLQFLMNVKTYIMWPGGKCKNDVDPKERKLFWKRLKRTLRNIGLNPTESNV